MRKYIISFILGVLLSIPFVILSPTLWQPAVAKRYDGLVTDHQSTYNVVNFIDPTTKAVYSRDLSVAFFCSFKRFADIPKGQPGYMLSRETFWHYYDVEIHENEF
jgi:hypothetical protein